MKRMMAVLVDYLSNSNHRISEEVPKGMTPQVSEGISWPVNSTVRNNLSWVVDEDIRP